METHIEIMEQGALIFGIWFPICDWLFFLNKQI